MKPYLVLGWWGGGGVSSVLSCLPWPTRPFPLGVSPRRNAYFGSWKNELDYVVDGEQGDSQETGRPGMGSGRLVWNRFSGDWTALHMMATVARLTDQRAAASKIGSFFQLPKYAFRLGETLTFNKPAKPLQSFDTCLPTAHARKQKSHCIALRAETKIGPQDFAKTRGFATTTSKIGSFFQLPKYAFRLGETLTFNKNRGNGGG